MRSEHSLIVIPGLGGDNRLFSSVVGNWNKRGFDTYIYDPHWYDGGDFESKLEMLLNLIDELREHTDRLSIVGTSAGGSMAVNAFLARTAAINKVITICSRLKVGSSVYPTLEQAAKKSLAFRNSVLHSEKGLSTLHSEDKKRILTLRALYDEIVPISTATVQDAHNIQVVSVEHLLTIGLCMTFFSKPMFDFLVDE